MNIGGYLHASRLQNIKKRRKGGGKIERGSQVRLNIEINNKNFFVLHGQVAGQDGFYQRQKNQRGRAEDELVHEGKVADAGQ